MNLYLVVDGDFDSFGVDPLRAVGGSPFNAGAWNHVDVTAGTAYKEKNTDVRKAKMVSKHYCLDSFKPQLVIVPCSG